MGADGALCDSRVPAAIRRAQAADLSVPNYHSDRQERTAAHHPARYVHHTRFSILFFIIVCLFLIVFDCF